MVNGINLATALQDVISDVQELFTWQAVHKEKHVRLEETLKENSAVVEIMKENNKFLNGLRKAMWGLLLPLGTAFFAFLWAIMSGKVTLIYN